MQVFCGCFPPGPSRYVTLIAAVEAFRTMGGQSLYDDVAYVKLELDNAARLSRTPCWTATNLYQRCGRHCA